MGVERTEQTEQEKITAIYEKMFRGCKSITEAQVLLILKDLKASLRHCDLGELLKEIQKGDSNDC